MSGGTGPGPHLPNWLRGLRHRRSFFRRKVCRRPGPGLEKHLRRHLFQPLQNPIDLSLFCNLRTCSLPSPTPLKYYDPNTHDYRKVGFGPLSPLSPALPPHLPTRARGPPHTIIMKVFASDCTFDYSWEEVSTANWRKYCTWNDKSTHVVAVDTLSRSVDPQTGIVSPSIPLSSAHQNVESHLTSIEATNRTPHNMPPIRSPMDTVPLRG